MYDSTAAYYDRMTADIDYKAYAEFFNNIISLHSDVKPAMVMDLGCGTGSLTFEMAGMGYDMTGVDSSPEMLNEAFLKKGPSILWVNQDLTELDLFGTYDVAVSLLDCVNHIADKEDVLRYFKLVHNFLEPRGLFIFDANTKYKFEHVLASNVFYSVEDDFAYIWENSYDSTTGLCEMDITVFEKRGGLYGRIDGTNEERCYEAGDIASMLENAGFEVMAVYGDKKAEKPDKDEQRIFFVGRKGDR
jgi:SAM-dependent methyltransferase